MKIIVIVVLGVVEMGHFADTCYAKRNIDGEWIR